MCNIYCVSRCVSVLVEECVGQLCEPSLSQSAAEERQEATRAKKTVHLLKILAELTPAQFASPEVFQNLLSLLRHDDSEIGGCCQWVWSRYIYIPAYWEAFEGDVIPVNKQVFSVELCVRTFATSAADT